MFRCTIRELVLLTLVVAMDAAWGLNRRSKSEVERRLMQQTEVLEVHRAQKRALQSQLDGLSELRLERSEPS
jgi:hypothetical protein